MGGTGRAAHDGRADELRGLGQRHVLEVGDSEAGFRMESSVGRLQSQQTTSRLSQFIRSCSRARRGSPERRCSRNRNWPPGRSTRRSSRSARGWSSTPHSTSVDTATSKVPSSNGRSSAGARSTCAAGACTLDLALQPAQHRGLRLGHGQRLDGRAVVRQVRPRSRCRSPAPRLLLRPAGRRGIQRSPALSVPAIWRSYVRAKSLVRSVMAASSSDRVRSLMTRT